MNTRFFFILFLTLSLNVFSQPGKRSVIGRSGCSVLSTCDFKYQFSKSQDSSLVYAGECVNEITYGVICVQLQNPPPDIETAETVVDRYLEHLRSSFNVVSASGYKKGLHLNNLASTRGITDNWVDEEKNNWKVQAWTNGKFILVLYGYSKKPITADRLNAFFNSAKFP
jgi:hypothetical protein